MGRGSSKASGARGNITTQRAVSQTRRAQTIRDIINNAIEYSGNAFSSQQELKAIRATLKNNIIEATADQLNVSKAQAKTLVERELKRMRKR